MQETTPEQHRQRNREHWSRSLDPLNLKSEGAPLSPERQIALARTADVEAALRFFGRLQGRHLLDLGGGLGLHAVIFARAGATVTIADLSSERLDRALALARELGVESRVRGVCCAAEELPFCDGTFDAAFTKSVLIHTQLDAAARELARVLDPNRGRAAFIEPLTGNPLVNLYRRYLGPAEWQEITRYFTAERLQVLAGAFRTAGADVRVRRLYQLAFLATPLNFILHAPGPYRVAEKLLLELDGAVGAIAPPYRKLAWFSITTVRFPAKGNGRVP